MPMIVVLCDDRLSDDVGLVKEAQCRLGQMRPSLPTCDGGSATDEQTGFQVLASGSGVDESQAKNPYSASSYVMENGNLQLNMRLNTDHSM